jgi:uncharacterized protein with PIN domain
MQATQREAEKRYSSPLVALEQRTVLLEANDRHIKARIVEAFRRTQRVQLRAADSHVVDAERHANTFGDVRPM